MFFAGGEICVFCGNRRWISGKKRRTRWENNFYGVLCSLVCCFAEIKRPCHRELKPKGIYCALTEWFGSTTAAVRTQRKNLRFFVDALWICGNSHDFLLIFKYRLGLHGTQPKRTVVLWLRGVPVEAPVALSAPKGLDQSGARSGKE